MPISIVVQSAETVTFLLTIVLCVRIFTLYRDSVPQDRLPTPEPMALPKPEPTPSQAPRDILENYIDELLGIVSAPEPYLEKAQPPEPTRTERNAFSTDEARGPEASDSRAYHSIAVFLSRRYNTESCLSQRKTLG